MSGTNLYINGYSNSAVEVYGKDETLIERVELPLCNSKGLMEYLDEQSIIHKLLNYTEEEKTIGYHLRWEANFDNKMINTYTSFLDRLSIHKRTGKKTYWIPRVDVPERKFQVNFDLSFALGILKGGRNAKGNKGIVVKCRTKYLQNGFGWINPNDVRYIGTYNNQYTGIEQTV